MILHGCEIVEECVTFIFTYLLLVQKHDRKSVRRAHTLWHYQSVDWRFLLPGSLLGAEQTLSVGFLDEVR